MGVSDAIHDHVSGLGPFRRALMLRGRQIFTVWLVGSLALTYVAVRELPPLYLASSLLRLDSTSTEAMQGRQPPTRDAEDLDFATQVMLLTSPNTLAAALNDPQVAAIPRIRNADDPVSELRGAVRALVMPNTHLVDVSIVGTSSAESATMVNAVVRSYLDLAGDWSDATARQQLLDLGSRQTEIEDAIQQLDFHFRQKLQEFDQGGAVPDAIAKLAARRFDNDLSRLEFRSRLEALDQVAADKLMENQPLLAERAELRTKVRAAELLDQALAEKAEQLSKVPGGQSRAQRDREIEMMRDARAPLAASQAAVRQQIERLKFDSRAGNRARVVSLAVPSRRPIHQGRLALALGVIPIAMLAFSAVLFGLVESLAGPRVAGDPADPRFGSA